jgi:hypothetical protein
VPPEARSNFLARVLRSVSESVIVSRATLFVFNFLREFFPSGTSRVSGSREGAHGCCGYCSLLKFSSDLSKAPVRLSLVRSAASCLSERRASGWVPCDGSCAECEDCAG